VLPGEFGWDVSVLDVAVSMFAPLSDSVLGVVGTWETTEELRPGWASPSGDTAKLASAALAVATATPTAAKRAYGARLPDLSVSVGSLIANRSDSDCSPGRGS
jgi:hypothetical protein